MADLLHPFPSFIKNSYGIRVAVRSTQDVEELCRKNHLSFCDLLRPFSQLSTEVQLRDHMGHLYAAKDLRLHFTEPVREPPSPEKVEKLLADNVHWSERGMFREGKSGPVVKIRGFEAPASTPWFDHYREAYLDSIQVLEHEYVRYYMAALLVVSSRQTRPLEAFSSLYRAQKEAEGEKFPFWFTPHLFYYHVLVHDVQEGNTTHASDSFELLKATYGASSCYFLPINSSSRQGPADESVPEPWTSFLRIPPSPVRIRAAEDTDGGLSGLKLGKNRSPKPSSPFFPQDAKPSKRHTAQKQTSPLANHTTSPVPEASALVRTTDMVREEAHLILDDNENEDDESIEKSSSNSSVVSAQISLGDDPLTQLGSETMTEKEAAAAALEAAAIRAEGEEGSLAGKERVGQCMSLADQNHLRSFTREFSLKLLPHLGAVLKKLHEICQSRRSMTRRMSNFSTRVWKMLGTSNFSGSTQTSHSTGEGGSFSPDSVERQMRLVGDMAFLLHNYELAYSMHHSLKKELQGKELSLLYAQALEMASLSGQMMNLSRRELQGYLHEAITLYKSSQLKMDQHSRKMSLLLCETVRLRRKYREVSQLYIKLVSEGEDLWNSLCLEQAAHAFLRVESASFVRKYAFHLILSGYHFSRSGQKAHAVRVFSHALEVYRTCNWAVAEDYVRHLCTRLNFSLSRPHEVMELLTQLLSHESYQSHSQQLSNVRDFIFVNRRLLSSATSSEPIQPPHSSFTSEENLTELPHLCFPMVPTQLISTALDGGISEAVFTWFNSILVNRHTVNNKISESGDSLLECSASLPLPSTSSSSFSPLKLDAFTLSLPRIKSSTNSTRNLNIIVGVAPYNPQKWNVSEAEWRELEGVCRHDNGEVADPAVFYMDQSTNNTRMASFPVNEPISVQLFLRNPLSIPVVLKKVALMWTFVPASNKASEKNAVVCQVLESLWLTPKDLTPLTLWLVAIQPGELKVVGFVSNLCVSESDSLPSPKSPIPKDDSLSSTDPDVQAVHTEGVQGTVSFACRGPRLNHSKEHRMTVTYASDYRLHWNVIGPMPKLLAHVRGLRQWLVMGEVCQLMLEVVNCGPVPLGSLSLTSSLQHCTLLEDNFPLRPVSFDNTACSSSSSSSVSVVSSGHSSPACPASFSLPLNGGSLGSGCSQCFSLLLHIPAANNVVGGKLPWNMVFTYRPTSGQLDNTMSHRTVRHSEPLAVRQMLETKVASCTSLQRSSQEKFDPNQFLMSLGVENKSGDAGLPATEVSIVQVSCISRSWEISVLKMDGELRLSPGDCGTLQLKARRRLKEGTEGGECMVALGDNMLFSDVYLTGKEMSSSSQFPVKDLFFASKFGRGLGLSRSSVASATRMEDDEEGTVRGDEGTLRGNEMALEDKVTLLLFWKGSARIGHEQIDLKGHLYLTVHFPQSMPYLSPSHPSPRLVPSSPYDLVKYMIHHPCLIHHDFSKGRVCVVPVKLKVYNCTSEQITVMLETLPPSEVAVGSRSHELMFHWNGTSKRNFTLPPASPRSMVVYAWFTTPGVYNLSSLRVKASYSSTSKEPHFQRFHQPSYITIMPSDTPAQ